MSSLREALDAVPELPAPEPEAPADDSILAAVRQRAAAITAEQTVDLEIPGYEGVLLGRYHAISISKFNRLTGNEVQVPFLDWRSAADALASALDGLYAIKNDEVVPLYTSGDPARYDDELAQNLGLAVTERSARAVMAALFGGGGKGESRVWQHFLTYQQWLMEGAAQEEVATRAVGEPSAAS